MQGTHALQGGLKGLRLVAIQHQKVRDAIGQCT